MLPLIIKRAGIIIYPIRAHQRHIKRTHLKMNVVTSTKLRAQLKEILDLSANQHEPIIIKRSKKRN